MVLSNGNTTKTLQAESQKDTFFYQKDGDNTRTTITKTSLFKYTENFTT